MSESVSNGPTRDDSLAATQISEAVNHTKEQKDIAFAAEAIDAGVLSERQFTSVLSNWTLHGTILLSDYLVHQRAITPDVRARLLQRATLRLNQLDTSPANREQMGLSSESVTRTALEQLDPSGRVARLLGISVATSAVTKDASREHTTRYQLVRRLGQGGLGTVWLARDTKLRRLVALKEIRQDQNASGITLNRFRREAEITGRLEHPGIVPIYQLGDDSATGKAFYTMRFLGKRTMQDAIVEYHERRESGDDDPMLLRELLTAFVSVCQAIGHAHSRKVIHRDLKPENVAIDNFGQVIVIDWGLAKVLDDEEVDDSFALAESVEGGNTMERTIAGQVLGSPLYMAPEQAAGRVDEIDHCTDVYGLGAILFSILSGYAPHDQSRLTSGSTTARELITAIASGPTPAATVSNADCDEALAAICSKAMSKKRYARYQSASDLAEEVQRWMAGETVHAYREKLSQRIGRWIQHHRRLSQLLGALAIMTLVILTTLMITSHQNRKAQRQTRFDDFRSDAREIELQLHAVAEKTRKDVRFMSNLPPIQAIIHAESGVEDGESLEVWRERLETIYEGLLSANPEYLGVTYLTVEDDRPREVVRVERHATERGFIRRVPVSRLATLDPGVIMAEVKKMQPGDARLVLGERISNEEAIVSRRSLIAVVPVFDDVSGDLYGLVAIETNVTVQIERILDGFSVLLGSIYVTDMQGRVWVEATPAFGVEIESDNVDVTALIPETKAFYAEGSNLRYLSDGEDYVAMRVFLDPTDSTCTLGLAMQLSDAP